MQNVEHKKRQLEDNYDSLSEELSRLQTQGRGHTAVDTSVKKNMRKSHRYPFIPKGCTLNDLNSLF